MSAPRLPNPLKTIALLGLGLCLLTLSGSAVQRIPGVGRFVIPVPPAASCTTTISSGANLNTEITNVAAGGTLCLNAGTYTTGTTITATKASQTTVKSVSGVGAVITQLNISGAQKITFDHLTITGLDLGNTATDFITISNSVQTANNVAAYWEIDCGNWTGSKTIVLDGNTHTNTYLSGTGGGQDGRISFVGGSLGSGKATANCGGLQVKNSTFSGVNNTYCSDAIFIQAGNIRIGPNNHFTDLQQGSCSAHVDVIQAYDGEAGITIDGNYFDDSTVAIGWYDGYDGPSTLGFTIANNVFDANDLDEHQFITINGFDNLTFEHNTLRNVDSGWGQKAGETPANTNVTMRSNLHVAGTGAGGDDSSLSGANEGSGFTGTRSYQLAHAGLGVGSGFPSCTPGCLTGAPTFVGALSFANWANWALAGGSTGENAAHDGTDIGTLCFGACS